MHFYGLLLVPFENIWCTNCSGIGRRIRPADYLLKGPGLGSVLGEALRSEREAM